VSTVVIMGCADPPEKWALRGPGKPAGATSRKLGQEISARAYHKILSRDNWHSLRRAR
jgi:hypothetical protein